MLSKAATLTRDEAETIAAQALEFLAGEPARLARFLELTGMRPSDIRQRVNDPSFLQAILDHVVAEESILLVFAAGASVAPETVIGALSVLQGRPELGST
jgi:chromosome segregation ATPase